MCVAAAAMIDITIAPRRAPTDDRRDAIARAARTLIVEKGVEGLRTRDIAERVGINIATLHYHVPSKEALIELVAESLRDDFVQQQIDRPRAHLSARQRMDLEFDDFREMALHSPATLQVFSELIERGRRDERIAEAILPMKHHWRQMLQTMLSEGVSDGDYRPDPRYRDVRPHHHGRFHRLLPQSKNGIPEVDPNDR